MQREKRHLILLILLTISLLVGIGAYGYFALIQGEMDRGSIISMVVPLLLVVFMSFVIYRRFKDVKQGMPLEDERSRKVMTIAGAKSFFITLYWLLAISMFEDFFAGVAGLENLDAGQTVGLGISGMAVLFFVTWLYYNKKGKLA